MRIPSVLLLLASLGTAPALPRGAAAQGPAPAVLEVPRIVQARERCGPASLEMVLRYYGADAAAQREAESAYDPVLRGSLITALAAAAQRAGYDADIATLTPDSLAGLVAAGVPPIVLFQRGPGPITLAHYGVVTGWDPARRVFTLNDGGARPRRMRSDDLARRWRAAGSQALIVTRRSR